MEYIYKPKGACLNLITIELDGKPFEKWSCRRLQRKWPGISQLVEGATQKR